MYYFTLLFTFLTFINSEKSCTNFFRLVHPFEQSCNRSSKNIFSNDLRQPISIETLLATPEQFHKKKVTVRGIVTQPEMHLDRTELFFDFVFKLKEGGKTLVVFGRHDRTQGSSPIAMGQTVEITGIFWKDRFAQDYHFTNNLEAITVTPYPSLIPDRT